MNRNPRPGGTARTGVPGWQEHAACRGEDPDLFFAPEIEYPAARKRRETQAKQVCARCPVRLPCLEWRLRSESQRDAGIWGGLNEDERILLRRRRVRAAAAAKRRAA